MQENNESLLTRLQRAIVAYGIAVASISDAKRGASQQMVDEIVAELRARLNEYEKLKKQFEGHAKAER
jgi:hypothetical protein